MSLPTFDKTITWHGSGQSKAQMILGIPAKEAADSPGLLVLQSVSDASAVANYWIWIDSNGIMRKHTSKPTNQDSDGSAVTGTTSALTQSVTIESGTYDAILSTTTQTTSAPTLTIPDFAGVSDTFMFLTLAQTVASKVLKTSCYFGDASAPTKMVKIACSSATATKSTTLTFAHTDDRAITFPDATCTLCGLDTSQALTGKTYNGLSVTAGSNTFNLTQGTASLDVAAGKTVNIDTDLTVNTEAVTLNQSVSTTDDVTFAAINATTLTTTGAITDGTMTINGTGTITGVAALTSTGLITCQGITNTVTKISSTVQMQVLADNVYLALGAGDGSDSAGDSRIYFDGDDLVLWDSKVGAYTLQQLATGTTMNPSVTGNLTIADGDFDWTNSANNETALWTLAATTVDGIDIASSNTTANVLHITANATDAGCLLNLTSVDATMTSGAYIYCYDGAAQDFAVRRYGATTIAGSAGGTAALTLTTGDIVVSSGRLLVTAAADLTSKFVRNVTTLTTPVLEIENTHISGGVCLLVDQKATGALDAIDVTYVGTASALNITNTVATAGTAITCVTATAATGKLVYLDGTTTDGWVGAADTGMLHLAGDGALAAAGTSLLYSNYTGAIATVNCLGTCGQFIDAGTASTHVNDVFAVNVASTNNSGLRVSTAATAGYGLVVAGPSAQTESLVYLDGTATNGWGGAANKGMLHLALDGATLDAAASALQIVIGTGTPTSTATGYALYINDTTTAAAAPATTYAAYIAATGAVANASNSGMKIVTGGTAARNLVLSGVQGQAASLLVVDGTTGTGWVGASNVGAVNITGDGTLAHVNASMLYIAHSGTGLASNLGSSLRINDSSTAAAGAYVAYMTSASNSVLNLVTAATGKTALVITGANLQTTSHVTIGSATTTWIGATGVGMLQLDSNGAIIADSSLLRVTSATQPAGANDGVCAEFIETGNAQATSYAVRITSTNNEALHVDTGLALFDEGPRIQYASAACTDNAPKIGEIDGAFGITTAAGYNGFIGVLHDTANASDDYICFTSNAVWFYLKGSIALA